MSSPESTPTENRKAPVPSSSMFKERMLEAMFGLLAGACLGGIVGAIALGLVGPLLAGNVLLFFVAGMAGAILGGMYGAVYGMLHGAFVWETWGPVGGPNTNRPKRVGRKIVIHLVCLVAVIMLAIYLWSVQAVNLPAASDVQSMTVDFFMATGKPGSFAVPSKHVPIILTALSPATRDWSPAKWEVLGQFQLTCKDGKQTKVNSCWLQIMCKDGRSMTVDLYRTYHAIGAFSVHLDDRPRNPLFVSSYFRGGTDQAIENAIKTAAATTAHP